jgi:hypothetical protein
MPEIIFLIPLAAIGLGAFATYLKHKERMAGLGQHGAGDGSLRQTVQLLTETLERQHDRQQALIKRLETLEAIVTNERLPEPPSAIALPEGEPSAESRRAGRTAA